MSLPVEVKTPAFLSIFCFFSFFSFMLFKNTIQNILALKVVAISVILHACKIRINLGILCSQNDKCFSRVGNMLKTQETVVN